MQIQNFLPLVTMSAALGALQMASAGDAVSLAGQWRFRLDRADAGVEERWFERALPDKVRLPGSLTEQGIGDDISTNTPWIGSIVDKSWFTAPEYAKYRQPGNVKVPFWLQPEKYYAGVAWYQRDIEIPADWNGKRVVLFLERTHWETRVWVDNRLVGTNNSLATPHEYDLGQLAPGKHTVSIRVDNHMVIDVGENSHCISDHTQGNWNGIVGKIELRVTPLVWIEEVEVYHDPSLSKFRAVLKIGNGAGKAGEGSLRVLYNHCAKQKPTRITGLPQRLLEAPVRWTAEGGSMELECALPRDSASPWDEFSPTLHPLGFELSTGDSGSVWVQRPQDLPSRHARLLHLPQDRPSADGG
jgi:beta-galactosidase/beta-glucuronidase